MNQKLNTQAEAGVRRKNHQEILELPKTSTLKSEGHTQTVWENVIQNTRQDIQ